MINIPNEILAKYKPASLPNSKPKNQSFDDFLLKKLDEADSVALEFPETYTDDEVFGPLLNRYTGNSSK
jgi:hypothetical protein